MTFARGPVLLVAFLLSLPTAARADVFDLGDGTVYSDDLSVAFLKDFGAAATTGYDSDGLMSWHEALGWIGYLNSTSYLGYSDWELAGAGPLVAGETASYYGQNYLEYLFYNELGNSKPLPGDGVDPAAFDYGPFMNVNTTFGGGYWLSPEAIDPGDCATNSGCYAYSYRILEDRVDGDPADWEYGVSAMRRANVPEPATLFLMGTGGVLLALRRRFGRLRSRQVQP